MKAKLLCFLIALAVMVPAYDVVLAQGGAGEDEGGIPVAEPPPQHPMFDGPPSHKERSQAALKLMLTVAVSLIVVFILLRFYVRPRLSEDEKQPEGRARYRMPGQDAIDRIQQALSERDPAGGDEAETDEPDRPA